MHAPDNQRTDWRTLRAIGIAALLIRAASADSLQGYTAQSSAQEASIEARYKLIPTPEMTQRQHRLFTAEPHPAGSERNNYLARYIAGEWKKQGLEDVVIRRYDVFSSEPQETLLEMVAPVPYRASLREAAYEADPDTKNPRISSAWMGMSKSGDITAPVIYAHSGNPEDFALLRAKGIDVKGKIVLVRYSNPYSYRGFKALTAEKEGVAAMLIYSDPAEDGYGKGKVFPDGPWGPESHLQRGAIEYDFQQAGDPTTPGWPSLPGAQHIPAAGAAPVPKIMALPISWQDAQPLMEHMDGPEAPEDWQGGLPFKYHLGDGRVRVHLKIQMKETLEPNYVVEGRIRGREYPDEWILAGNHRDAWVFGGSDPSSGTASMMEMTRSLGRLLKEGTRPRRTIMFLSWDGEETSFAGSVEWSEQFDQELRQKAVAYLNVDMAASGPNFQGQSIGSLAPLLVGISKSLPDPSGKSLYEAWQISRARELQEAGESEPLTDFNLSETGVGSGSDYAALLDHAGVPIIDLTFDGPYGVYHSAYDNYYWMNHFGDPGYRYQTLMAKLWGVLALRLSNADFLPFSFASYGAHIRQYLDTLGRKQDLSKLDLGSVRRAIEEFEAAGRKLDVIQATALASGSVDPLLADQVNRGVMGVERNFLDPNGIPGRPWYKHLVYACRQTYAHLELPGLTEAAEAGNWPLAQEQAARLAAALRVNTALVLQMAQMLGCGGGIHSNDAAVCDGAPSER